MGAAFAAPAHAADGSVRFSTMPATASGPDGRVAYSYSAAPGQNVQDWAAVVNSSDSEQTFAVYLTDASNNDAGEFTLLPGSEAPKDLGAWGSVEGQAAGKPFSVTVPAMSSKLVRFDITVPAAASPGDHSAGLVVSQERAGQVRLDARVASRIMLRVNGDLQAMLSVGGVQADFHRSWNPLNGTLDLTYTLTNPGNTALASTVVPRLKALGFIPVGSATGTIELDELMPGNTRTVHQRITGVPEAVFLALNLELTPKQAPGRPAGGDLRKVERGASVVALPFSVLAVIALIVLAIWFARRRRKRNAVRLAAAYAAGRAAEAETPKPLGGSQ